MSIKNIYQLRAIIVAWDVVGIVGWAAAKAANIEQTLLLVLAWSFFIPFLNA